MVVANVSSKEIFRKFLEILQCTIVASQLSDNLYVCLAALLVEHHLCILFGKASNVQKLCHNIMIFLLGH